MFYFLLSNRKYSKITATQKLDIDKVGLMHKYLLTNLKKRQFWREWHPFCKILSDKEFMACYKNIKLNTLNFFTRRYLTERI